jgi:hypothetical protein
MKICSTFALLLLITTAAQSAEKVNGPSASQPIAYPVRLISFTAKATLEGVELEWRTASEANNAYFTIERSTDAVHFKAIQQFKGAGNSDNVLKYLAVDQSKLSGTAYYRLTQTSTNGESTASKTISVISTSGTNFSIYPFQAGTRNTHLTF